MLIFWIVCGVIAMGAFIIEERKGEDITVGHIPLLLTLVALGCGSLLLTILSMLENHANLSSGIWDKVIIRRKR